MIVHGVRVIVQEVVSVNVVDIPVAVVVDARQPVQFRRVGPDVGREVRVRVVNACIDDRDSEPGVTLPNVPTADRADVSPRSPGVAVHRLTCVPQAPLEPKSGIVGCREDVHLDVGLRVENRRIIAICCQRRIDISIPDLNKLQSTDAAILPHDSGRPHQVMCPPPRSPAGRVLESNQDATAASRRDSGRSACKVSHIRRSSRASGSANRRFGKR